jgi:hypothetical protein
MTNPDKKHRLLTLRRICINPNPPTSAPATTALFVSVASFIPAFPPPPPPPPFPLSSFIVIEEEGEEKAIRPSDVSVNELNIAKDVPMQNNTRAFAGICAAIAVAAPVTVPVLAPADCWCLLNKSSSNIDK